MASPGIEGGQEVVHQGGHEGVRRDLYRHVRFAAHGDRLVLDLEGAPLGASR